MRAVGTWVGVVALCGACGSAPSSPRDATIGDDASATIDAAIGDAAIDAPLDDAALDAPVPPVILPSYQCDPLQSGTVRVHTNTANVPLLVHDVSGTLVQRTTSATGVVDLAVPGCGSVTAIRSGLFHTITFVGDGDELWIEAPPGLPASRLGPARLYIDVPAPGTSSYFFVGPVSSSLVAGEPTAHDVFWRSRNLTPEGFSTFAVHRSGPTTDAWALFENVSLPAAQTMPLRITSWSTETTTYQVDVTIPANATFLHAGLTNWFANSTYGTHNYSTKTPSTSNQFLATLASYGDALVVGAKFGDAQGRSRSIGKLIPKPATPTITFDLTPELLPEILSTSIVPSATRPRFSWSIAGGGLQPDLIVFRTYGPAMQWRFALPPGLESYQLPELPIDLAVDFSGVSELGLTLHEASDYAGYAEARGRFVETFIVGRIYPAGFRVRSSTIGDAL